MAQRNIFTRGNIGPGVLISPWVPLDAAVKALGGTQFDFDVTTPDWDDPVLLMTIAVEFSTDGGATAQHLASQTNFGNTRNKAGEIPNFSFSLANVPDGALVRGILTLNQRTRIGILGDI